MFSIFTRCLLAKHALNGCKLIDYVHRSDIKLIQKITCIFNRIKYRLWRTCYTSSRTTQYGIRQSKSMEIVRFTTAFIFAYCSYQQLVFSILPFPIFKIYNSFVFQHREIEGALYPSLTPPLFAQVSVPSQQSEWSCIYVFVISRFPLFLRVCDWSNTCNL
jgi:hypothetical protein